MSKIPIRHGLVAAGYRWRRVGQCGRVRLYFGVAMFEHVVYQIDPTYGRLNEYAGQIFVFGVGDAVVFDVEVVRITHNFYLPLSILDRITADPGIPNQTRMNFSGAGCSADQNSGFFIMFDVLFVRVPGSGSYD